MFIWDVIDVDNNNTVIGQVEGHTEPDALAAARTAFPGKNVRVRRHH